jgi:phosphoserine phosphatase
MRFAVTLVGSEAAAAKAAAPGVRSALASTGAEVKAEAEPGPHAVDLIVEAAERGALRAAAEAALGDVPVDVCVQPAEGRRKRLLIADMDSTIIGCECLDELADFAGLKPQISAITERAMRGDLNFEAALKERVGMLKGLDLSALQRAYDDRVRLNPGARTAVRTMAAHGALCVLVSGGFTYFTDRVAEAAGFADNRANRLIDDGRALTGEVAEPILGREAKLSALHEYAARIGADLPETLAIGDGANDLAMIGAAGLGVAYRAKPIVAQEADVKLGHADLTALLYFQGYTADQFVTG